MKTFEVISRFSLLAVFTLGSQFVFAGSYTANHVAKVKWVKIYQNDIIYFGLDSMPSDTQCPGSYFTLDPGLSEVQRNRWYSMLLTARTIGVAVSVGYDKESPDCYSTKPIAHALSY